MSNYADELIAHADSLLYVNDPVAKTVDYPFGQVNHATPTALDACKLHDHYASIAEIGAATEVITPNSVTVEDTLGTKHATPWGYEVLGDAWMRAIAIALGLT